MKFKKWMFALVLAESFLLLGADSQVLTVTTFGRGGPLDRDAAELVRKAYAQIGVAVEFVSLPGERAIRETNAGETDAELMRKDGLTEFYPNLIEVKVPVAHGRIVAFALTGAPRINTWVDLKDKRFSYERGTKIIETMTAGFPYAYPVENNSQSYAKLVSHLIDYVIVEQSNGWEALKMAGLDQTIAVASEVLASDALYHYVNKKHADLVPKLEEALARLTAPQP